MHRLPQVPDDYIDRMAQIQQAKAAIADPANGAMIGWIWGNANELLTTLEAQMQARVASQEGGSKGGGRPKKTKPTDDQIKQQLLELRKGRTARNARVLLVKNLQDEHHVSATIARTWVRNALAPKPTEND
jgi:hypothetical protein